MVAPKWPCPSTETDYAKGGKYYVIFGWKCRVQELGVDPVRWDRPGMVGRKNLNEWMWWFHPSDKWINEMLNKSLNLNQFSFQRTHLLANFSDSLLFTSWLVCKFFNIVLRLTGSFLSSISSLVSLYYQTCCNISHHQQNYFVIFKSSLIFIHHDACFMYTMSLQSASLFTSHCNCPSLENNFVKWPPCLNKLTLSVFSAYLNFHPISAWHSTPAATWIKYPFNFESLGPNFCFSVLKDSLPPTHLPYTHPRV